MKTVRLQSEWMKQFSVEKLGEVLEREFPEIDFAILFGSAVNGMVADGSDIDIALWLNSPASYEFYCRFYKRVEEVTGHEAIDVSILNNADPILSFETLKGKRLFVRETVDYHGFFSLTCRLYENQMYRFEYQRRQKPEKAGNSN